MESRHARDWKCGILFQTPHDRNVTCTGDYGWYHLWFLEWPLANWVVCDLYPLPFCDPFIPFSACLLTSRFQSLHAALPPDFPGLLPQYALFSYFTSSKSKYKYSISYSPLFPLSPYCYKLHPCLRLPPSSLSFLPVYLLFTLETSLIIPRYVLWWNGLKSQ